ncbi:LmbE-like protein [Mycena maculata]|uniref:N-acetylglucosaminylphosphatidylinositol deacetylase n=1 Tax=Mycena maculata TaxID=230809 RepID=A0AAD7MET4_9AGAR|nr:LmbE-like protein [Mycena maculata]
MAHAMPAHTWHPERQLPVPRGTAHPDDETFFFSPTLTAFNYSSMDGLEDIFYLQDNKTTSWDSAVISNEILSLVVEYNITTILTFDSHGITGHPNHQSALAGVVHLISSSLPRSPSIIRPRLFALYSRPSTKHLGPLAAFVAPRYISSRGPFLVASLIDYVTALRSMSKHTSQLRMIPFLKGFFSRYLWVNEWVEVIVDANYLLE